MPCYAFEGHRPCIASTAYVHPMAVVIGRVTIGEACYIGPSACLRGDFGSIVIEDAANVQDTCVIHGNVAVETRVATRGHVGHGAVLHGCHIGRDVLVGMNAVVMDDCRIGDRSIIGSSSFVKAGFACPPASLLLGTPARIVRQLSHEEIRAKRAATQQYIDLARRSLDDLVEC